MENIVQELADFTEGYEDIMEETARASEAQDTIALATCAEALVEWYGTTEPEHFDGGLQFQIPEALVPALFDLFKESSKDPENTYAATIPVMFHHHIANN